MDSSTRSKCLAVLSVLAAAAVLQVGPAPASDSLAAALSQEVKLTAAGSRQLGYSVAISGDTAIVGVDGTPAAFGQATGAAYVFVRRANEWILQQTLTSSTMPASRYAYQFGVAVAISGNTAVVGEGAIDSTPPFKPQGRAHVFARDGTTWTEEATLAADDGAGGDAFGRAVAISGGTVVVGSSASYVVEGLTSEGAAFVFVRQNGAWTKQQKLTAGDGDGSDSFGHAVAISGNTVVAGAPGKGPMGADASQGAGYFYVRSGTGWTLQQQVFASDASPVGRLGESVAIDGNTAVLGAPAQRVGTENHGAAYVFSRTGTTWSEQRKLVASDGSVGRLFGFAVAMQGPRVLVGGNRNGPGGGKSYVFERRAGSWSEIDALHASDGDVNDLLGFSVGMSGEVMLAGAPNVNRAYAFQSSDTDGDALPDDWERLGVTVDADGHARTGNTGDGEFVDLPAMGANPLHKDVFVHADWMLPGPASAVLKLDPRAIRIVSDAFATAPVPNPHGKTGIHLHVDLGPDSLMNPVTGQRWGTLSNAGPVPFQQIIGATNPDGTYNWSAVDQVKQTHFALTRRRVAFHYALIANAFTPRKNSGQSRGIDGADFLVTLGDRPTPGGTILDQAGTFMHELGHNLALRHGGGDHENWKPNYLSVMNYRYQLIGLLRPAGAGIRRRFDYSRRLLPALDELNLDENTGIADPDRHLTMWNPHTRADVPAGSNRCLANRVGYFRLFLPSAALDWSCDGSRTLTPVVADLNQDGYCVQPGPDKVLNSVALGDDDIRGTIIVSGPNRTCESLAAGDDKQSRLMGFVEPNVVAGFADWPALAFTGGGVLGAGLGAGEEPPLSTPIDEATQDELLDAVPPELLEEEDLAPQDAVTYAPQEGEAPLTIDFDGGASTAAVGSVVEWTWDFGDGATASGPSVTHTYTVPGTYFASLAIRDSGDRINLVPLLHRVTVLDGPAPTTSSTSTSTTLTTTTITPSTSTTTSTTILGPGSGNPGDVDRGFTATATVNVGQVYAVVTQPDGKTVVGGEFESFAGCPRRGVARLLPDGSCDPTFDPGLALTRVVQNNLGGMQRGPVLVQALALQPDGKLLVGIGYPAFVGQAPLLFRLNPDGTRDPSFDASGLDASASATPGVSAIARQADGRIVVGGVFGYGNAGSKANIVRLEANGSLDPSFTVPSGTPFGGTNAVVSALGLQADGKVVIGGAFSCVGFGATCSAPYRRLGIARLETDGSLDTAFNVQDPVSGRFASGLELASEVFGIAVQPDGRLLVAGILRAADGSITPVARLDTAGGRDGTFANPFGVAGVFDARGLALQADGRVVVGGQFQVASPLRTRIARLNDDGTFDATFDPGGGFDGSRRFVYAVASHANGRVVVGGDFTAFDGAPAESIVQLGTDGRRDASFASRGPGQNGEVLALVRQPDGKILVGMNAGLFDYQRLNATRRNGIGRLNADGSTDTSFVSPLSANATVAGIALQPDGKVIVLGSFTTGSRTDFARLHADGSLDASFDPQIEGSVAAVAVEPGGKMIIGGNFTRLNGAFSQRIARLDADGGTDTSFTATIAAGGVSALAVQPDGHILVAGVFPAVNSTPRNNIARLEPDGTLDPGFDAGGGPDDAVRTLLPRADGKIVIGGIFRSYGGTPRDGMARIHAGGALDASFDPVNPGGRRRGGMAQYPDGGVVVGSIYRGDTALPPPNRVLRLDVNGQLDPAFALGTGVEGTSVNVHAILLDADDGIVIGGEFDVVNGAARLGLARLLGAVPTAPTSTTTTTTSTSTSSSSSSVPDTTTSSTTVITSSTTTVPVPSTTSTTLPCILSALPVDSVAGVRCAIDRVRRTLEEPAPLACARCKRCALQPALDRVARLVNEADAAASAKACQKRLKSARGAAKALRGKVRSLAQRRCFEPADRAATLTAGVEDLHGRVKAVSRSAWCRSR